MIRVTAAVLRRKGRVLLARRTRPEWLAGKWEFPGGKVEPGEDPRACLARELSEELGVEVAVGEHLVTVQHAYPELELSLEAYEARILTGEPHPHEHDRLLWVRPAEIEGLDLAPADWPIVEHLLRRPAGPAPRVGLPARLGLSLLAVLGTVALAAVLHVLVLQRGRVEPDTGVLVLWIALFSLVGWLFLCVPWVILLDPRSPWLRPASFAGLGALCGTVASLFLVTMGTNRAEALALTGAAVGIGAVTGLLHGLANRWLLTRAG